jgi:TetR/AcrR family transcriptional repressor of bet genes
LRCLREHGIEGASVRRIAAEADVSMGLINHYFLGSASLIAAAYESLANDMLAAIRQEVERAGPDPRTRLQAFLQAHFRPEGLEPGIFRIWLVFWSLVAHSDQMRAIHDLTYAKTRDTLEQLLNDLQAAPGIPRFTARAAAIGLTALMDGLWVEMSLNPTLVDADEARQLCEDWIRALAAGALPSLRTAAARRPQATRRRR